jgi:hypothetical protein
MVFLEPFLYHPLLIWFGLKGYFNFYTSRQMEWGTMTRQGFDNTNTKKPAISTDNTANNG